LVTRFGVDKQRTGEPELMTEAAARALLGQVDDTTGT
jgi:hypothetical protein